jgi:hypothetical protein
MLVQLFFALTKAVLLVSLPEAGISMRQHLVDDVSGDPDLLVINNTDSNSFYRNDNGTLSFRRFKIIF